MPDFSPLCLYSSQGANLLNVRLFSRFRRDIFWNLAVGLGWQAWKGHIIHLWTSLWLAGESNTASPMGEVDPLMRRPYVEKTEGLVQ